MANFPGLFFKSGSGSPVYTANAVDYNGATNWLNRGADFTGNVDSSTGIFSAWVRLDGGDSTTIYLLGAENGHVQIRRTNTNLFLFRLLDSGGTVLLAFQTVVTYIAGATWYNILASWDTNFIVGNKLSNLYVNNVSDKTVTTDSVLAGNVDYTSSDYSVGSVNAAGASLFDGCLSELYFAPGQYLDFTNATNRQKFISLAGETVSLGADGSTPTGIAPIYYSKGNAAAVATNSGTGGNMTASGVFNDCSTTPS